MALTISEETVDAWAEVAQDAFREGATKDISPNYGTILHIDVALGTETAHTGTEVLVQVSSSTADDEFWTTLKSFVVLVGTAALEAITNNPLAVGGTSITVASTTGFATNGTLLFLEDATFANSELVYQSDFVTNTSITILDGVKREHANTAVLFNLAETFAIELPLSTLRCRVVYNNAYDPDGSTVATRTRLVKTTALS